jgi:hypothetical protein
VQEKLTSIIRNSYEGLTYRVMHGNQLTDAFLVKTGVRQGCLLSPFVFLLAIDWVMKAFTTQKQNDMQGIPCTQHVDLDFADDLALLSYNQQQMQEKTSTVVENSKLIDLNVHRGKGKALKVNTASTTSIKLDVEALEEVESFTYLGSIVDKQGETDDDIKIKIGKAGRFPEAKKGMNIQIPVTQLQNQADQLPCKVSTTCTVRDGDLEVHSEHH